MGIKLIVYNRLNDDDMARTEEIIDYKNDPDVPDDPGKKKITGIKEPSQPQVGGSRLTKSRKNLIKRRRKSNKRSS